MYKRQIQAYVQQQAGDDCDVILGMGNDSSLGDNISVTVIATGFNYKPVAAQLIERKVEDKKVVISLDKSDATSANLAPTATVAVVDPMAPILQERTESKEDIVNTIVNNVWERNLSVLNEKKEEPILAESKSTEASISEFQIFVKPEVVEEEKPCLLYTSRCV